MMAYLQVIGQRQTADCLVQQDTVSYLRSARRLLDRRPADCPSLTMSCQVALVSSLEQRYQQDQPTPFLPLFRVSAAYVNRFLSLGLRTRPDRHQGLSHTCSKLRREPEVWVPFESILRPVQPVLCLSMIKTPQWPEPPNEKYWE